MIITSVKLVTDRSIGDIYTTIVHMEISYGRNCNRFGGLITFAFMPCRSGLALVLQFGVMPCSQIIMRLVVAGGTLSLFSIVGLNDSNISAALVEGISAAYGEHMHAVDLFDAILCLLSATSYSLRFAEDLEDVFPHVPFPAQRATFEDAVRVGRAIRGVESFAREPSERYRSVEFARVVTPPRGAVVPVQYVDSSITLCANGAGRITGVPEPVWNFSVSGYRVLPRWLEARVGLDADLALVREFRDICGRVAELIDLFAQADMVLEATLQQTLTREALGLRRQGQQANDG